MKIKRRNKQCRKIGYPSEGYARNALRKLKAKGRSEARIYKCPHHDHEVWHLTKQTRTERRVKAENA